MLDTAQIQAASDGKYEIELKIYRAPADTTPLSFAIHLLPEPHPQEPPTQLNLQTTQTPNNTPNTHPIHPQERIRQQLHSVDDSGDLELINQERERALRAAHGELQALQLRQAVAASLGESHPLTPRIVMPAPACIAGDQCENQSEILFDKPTPDTSFITYFRREALSMTNGKTRQSYISALTNICGYEKGDPRFRDITVSWLRGFERFLVGNGLSTNSISVYLRNVRSIYNRAIDEDVADQSEYPFRRFRIKQERTRKRSLSMARLCELRDFDCHPRLGYYRDIFMLIFYLRGINVCDLFKLTEIRNGYIEYRRSKTGRWFSVKVEPEAHTIFNRYQGANHLIADADEGIRVDTFTKRINRGLKSLGAPWTYGWRGAVRTREEQRSGSSNSGLLLLPDLLEPQTLVESGALVESAPLIEPEPELVKPEPLLAAPEDDELGMRIEHMLRDEVAGESRYANMHGAFPDLSTYWARHTWATIAASLDIPKETIAAGLGHATHTVTDIYIDFDNRKIDEANRRIIDALNKFGK